MTATSVGLQTMKSFSFYAEQLWPPSPDAEAHRPQTLISSCGHPVRNMTSSLLACVSLLSVLSTW